MPVYSATRPLRLLSVLFLPWFSLPCHPCAIKSAQTCQLWGWLTVPTPQAVGSCEQGAGPCMRVHDVFLVAVFSKCGKKWFGLFTVDWPKKAKEKLGRGGGVCRDTRAHRHTRAHTHTPAQTRVHTHAHTRTHPHTSAHTCTDTCTHGQTHTCTDTQTHAHTHRHTCTRTHTLSSDSQHFSLVCN